MHKQWVIPDIHGYLKTLRALIENQIRPSKHDWLYFLGDYIDRGPDSKGVIDYIRKLQDDQYNVRLLRGNHEDYCLHAFYYRKQFRDYFTGNNITTIKKSYWRISCFANGLCASNAMFSVYHLQRWNDGIIRVPYSFLRNNAVKIYYETDNRNWCR